MYAIGGELFVQKFRVLATIVAINPGMAMCTYFGPGFISESFYFLACLPLS